MTQRFYGRLLAQFTAHRSPKFGRVPFDDPCLRSLAMKQNAELTEGGYKWRSKFELFVDQSSCCFGTIQDTPCSCKRTCRLSISCFIPKIQAIKVAVKLRNRQKSGFGPPICRGKYAPDFGIHFQIALTSEHVAGFGRVPFSELRGQMTR